MKTLRGRVQRTPTPHLPPPHLQFVIVTAVAYGYKRLRVTPVSNRTRNLSTLKQKQRELKFEVDLITSPTNHIVISQISVTLAGVITMGSVISRVTPVQTGPVHQPNVAKQGQSLLMSTTMKKMFIYSIVIMEESRGLVSMTFCQKAPSLGQIEELGTLQLGPRVNRTTIANKTAYTHLV